jgi:Lon protease-like protein
VNVREIPLFPLQTVLYPGGALDLRIFETRYLDMVSRCMRDGSGFGVVLLVRGPEVKASGVRVAAIGTEAQIIDFDRLDDGLLGVRCQGLQRFHIRRHWQAEDGLFLAEVEDVVSDPFEPVPEDCVYLSMVLKRLHQDYSDVVTIGTPHYDDAGWVANRLAELVGTELPTRQKLLELVDPIERLRALGPHVKIAALDA